MRPGAPGASARGTTPRGPRQIPLGRPESRSAPDGRGPPRADYTSVIGHEVHTHAWRREVRDLCGSEPRTRGHETTAPTLPRNTVRLGRPRRRMPALVLRDDERRAA